MIKRNVPPNVHFAGEVPNDQLHDLLSTQEFYLQLSITEGFPNALCEAMLCECIPIGSNVGAIPEIINDEKFILKKKDAGQLIQILEQALKSDRKTIGPSARERIKENYTIEKRRDGFMKLFRKIGKE